MEVWKDVIGYEGIYKVSSFGRVKSIDRLIWNKHNKCYHKQRGLILKQSINFGYYLVCVYKEGVGVKQVRVHRLVALAFIPNLSNKLEVNHINGIKSDNRVENLEWCTRSENVKHGFLLGTRTREQYVRMNRLSTSNCNRKKIIDNSTGVVYNSLKDAAYAFSMKRTTLIAMLSGQNKNKTHLSYLKSEKSISNAQV